MHDSKTASCDLQKCSVWAPAATGGTVTAPHLICSFYEAYRFFCIKTYKTPFVSLISFHLWHCFLPPQPFPAFPPHPFRDSLQQRSHVMVPLSSSITVCLLPMTFLLMRLMPKSHRHTATMSPVPKLMKKASYHVSWSKCKSANEQKINGWYVSLEACIKNLHTFRSTVNHGKQIDE